MIVICCGNETFLCGNSELKAHKGFWFSVTYGVILPWWVPKLRNVGKIPQQSCRILSYVLWFMYGACYRWCFFLSGIEIYTQHIRRPCVQISSNVDSTWSWHWSWSLPPPKSWGVLSQFITHFVLRLEKKKTHLKPEIIARGLYSSKIKQVPSNQCSLN